MKLNENLQFHKPETKETLGRFLSVPLFSVSALLRFKQFILLQLSSPPRLCSNKGLQATDAIGGRKAAFGEFGFNLRTRWPILMWEANDYRVALE